MHKFGKLSLKNKRGKAASYIYKFFSKPNSTEVRLVSNQMNGELTLLKKAEDLGITPFPKDSISLCLLPNYGTIQAIC